MYGWRGRIGLLVPSTNFAVEPEFNRAVPEGVSIHAARCVLNENVETDEEKMQAVIDMGLIKPTSIGRQWGRIKKAPRGKDRYEIDIMAEDKVSGEILYAECKWSANVNAHKLLQQLKAKAEHVYPKRRSRKIKYILFAMNFYNKIEGICIDLDDLGQFYSLR